MRSTALFLLPLALIALSTVSAFADDEAPTAVNVPFGLDQFAATAEELPEGWRILESAVPASAPSAEGITAIAKAVGIAEDKISVRCMSLAKGEGDKAILAAACWLSLDEHTPDFTARMVGTTVMRGWKVKQISSPARLVISWAANAEALKAVNTWQVNSAVKRLCQHSLDLFRSLRQERDRNAQQRKFIKAQAVLEAAGTTEPRASMYHALKAQLVGRQDPEAALDHNRKALAKDAPAPAPDAMLVSAAYSAGQALLNTQKDDVLPEALAILERGVALEKAAASPMMRFGNRYNLACAYARMNKIDEAFEHLEESLSFLKTTWEADKAKTGGFSQLNYSQHYEHAKTVDTDLTPLRSDKRWAAVIAKFDPERITTPEKSDGDK